MPPAPAWLSRLPEIRATLERLDTPVLGRAEIEKLFGLRRRQALRLLAPLATLEAGRTALVPRARLLAWLDSLAGKKTVALEQARRCRLDAALDTQLETLAREAKARRRVVDLPEPAADGESWPSGISLSAPGELRIRYERAEDLLGRVLALTELAAGDPDRFAARVEAQPRAEKGRGRGQYVEQEDEREAKP